MIAQKRIIALLLSVLILLTVITPKCAITEQEYAKHKIPKELKI